MGIKKAANLDEKRRNPKLPYIILITGLILTFLAFNLIENHEEEQVTIIVASRVIKSTDVINKNVNLIPIKIPISKYNELNSLVNSETEEAMAPLVTADKVTNVESLRACDVIYPGTYLRQDMFTEEISKPNPWKEKIPKDYEIYTMNFDASDVNTKLLYPGSLIRVRVVVDVPNEYVEEVKSALEQKQSLIDSGAMKDGESVLLNYSTQLRQNSGTIANISSSTTPVSEVIFKSIRITDMLNGADESIYDIYMSLLALPRNERLAMVKTSLAESDTSFASRIKPSKLVYVVNESYASILSEFENWTNANLKYTILNEENPDDIYNQIVNVSESIFNFSDTYDATSK